MLSIQVTGILFEVLDFNYIDLRQSARQRFARGLHDIRDVTVRNAASVSLSLYLPSDNNPDAGAAQKVLLPFLPRLKAVKHFDIHLIYYAPEHLLQDEVSLNDFEQVLSAFQSVPSKPTMNLTIMPDYGQNERLDEAWTDTSCNQVTKTIRHLASIANIQYLEVRGVKIIPNRDTCLITEDDGMSWDGRNSFDPNYDGHTVSRQAILDLGDAINSLPLTEFHEEECTWPALLCRKVPMATVEKASFAPAEFDAINEDMQYVDRTALLRNVLANATPKLKWLRVEGQHLESPAWPLFEFIGLIGLRFLKLECEAMSLVSRVQLPSLEELEFVDVCGSQDELRMSWLSDSARLSKLRRFKLFWGNTALRRRLVLRETLGSIRHACKDRKIEFIMDAKLHLRSHRDYTESLEVMAESVQKLKIEIYVGSPVPTGPHNKLFMPVLLSLDFFVMDPVSWSQDISSQRTCVDVLNNIDAPLVRTMKIKFKNPNPEVCADLAAFIDHHTCPRLDQIDLNFGCNGEARRDALVVAAKQIEEAAARRSLKLGLTFSPSMQGSLPNSKLLRTAINAMFAADVLAQPIGMCI